MKRKILKLSILSYAFISITIATQAQWTENSTSVYMTAGTKKMGIGTTVPSFKLDIKDTANVSFRLQSTLNGSTNLILARSLSSKNCLVNYKTGLNDLWLTGCLGDDNFKIYNALTFPVFSIMQSTGNVGIGNTSPVFKLDVKGGSINTDSIYRIRGKRVLAVSDNDNTFVGVNSGEANTTGNNNTTIGAGALAGNTSGLNNTALGYRALFLTTSGHYNTACGAGALYSNTTGLSNTAIGMSALSPNTTGNYNTSNGFGTLGSNTTGSSNTANGYYALSVNTTGNFNSALGMNSYFALGNLSNTTSIGYGSGGKVNTNNRVEIGNSSVTVIAGQVGFSTYSDARIKDNVQQDVPGLAFINKLRPVTYNLNIHKENAMMLNNTLRDKDNWDGKYDIEKIKMTGFLAQDVEQAANEAGYDFSGVQTPANPDELYSLRYSDFVMPLVKAVQELDAANIQLAINNEQLKFENQNQQLSIVNLQSTVDNLQNEITEMKLCYETLCTKLTTEKANSSQLEAHSFLNQNNPNPFKENTTIGFYISSASSKALLKIFSMNGEELKSFIISTKGKGQIEIAGNTLAPGVYTYVLIVDDRTVDTKQMVVTK